MVNFVIGIGSQRAGSTLLHKIVNECTAVFMHPVKELHYYDTLFDVRHEAVLKKFSKRQLTIEEGSEEGSIVTQRKLVYGKKRYECYIRANKLLAKKPVSQIEYLDLYRPCILANELLGEITPEYMILPDEGVKKMRDDLGAETKIILLARNPVERLISAVKLLKVYNNDKADLSYFSKDFNEILSLNGEWLQVQHKLNNYQSALNKFKKYFSNILFLSYDQIFLQPEYTAKSLQVFLGVEVDFNKYKKIIKNKVNSITGAGEILLDDRKYLETLYISEIKYLESFFGSGQCMK